MSKPEIWNVSLGALSIGVLEIGDSRGDIVCELHRHRYHGENAGDKMFDAANLISAAPDAVNVCRLLAEAPDPTQSKNLDELIALAAAVVLKADTAKRNRAGWKKP